MKSRSLSIALCLSLFVLGGCVGTPMRDAQFKAEPSSEDALVTFVRDAVWMGDGIHFYLWDGDKFIGALSAGTMVQYRTTPGPHVFMANAENWSYVTGDLKPGKHYYIKANVFPGFGTARAALVPVENSDERRKKWHTDRKIKEVIPEKADKYVQANVERARAALQKANDGEVKAFEMTEQHAQ